MADFWSRKFIYSPITIFLIISFVYSYVYIVSNNSLYYTDEYVACTNLFQFTVHFIILAMISRRNRCIKNSIYNILLRINQEKLIIKLLTYIVIEVLIIVIVVYGIPLLIYHNNFLNIQLYLIYIILWFLIFLMFEIFMLISIFIENKTISLIFLIIPFVLNVILQLSIMSLIYR